MKNCE